MGSYLVRRLLLMVLTLFGMSILIFVMLRLVPGNIADILVDAAGIADAKEKAKIIPHVDCTPRICELVRYYLEDVTVKGAWSGPAALQFFDHAMCDVNRLPVREVVSASHFVTDLTLGLGEVVFDYLAK